MSTEHQVLLDKAKTLARNGEYADARQILLDILEENPYNEAAWIWLVDVLPGRNRRVEALRRCLEYLPDSRAAKISLRRVEEGLPPVTREGEPWRSEPKPIIPPPPPPPPPKPPLQERLLARWRAFIERTRSWKGWRWVRVSVSVIVVIIAGLVGSYGMSIRMERQAQIYSLTATPAAARATRIANRTYVAFISTKYAPTPTPTFTPTLTPTPTSTPTISPTPTTTLAPNLIASGSVDRIEEVFTLDIESALGLAFSPDGQMLASSTWDGSVRVWDVANRSEFVTFKAHTKSVYGLAFSPDGNTLATAGWDRKVYLWDLKNGEQIKALEGHTNLVFNLAFSSDGSLLASGDADGIAKIWDVRSGKEVLTLGHDAAVYSLAFSPVVNVLAAGTGVNITPDTDSAVIKLWDAETGDELLTLEGHNAEVYGLAFSIDGDRLVSTSADTSIRIWEVYTGKQVEKIEEHTSSVVSVAYAPHGRMFATASHDGTIILWDATKNESVYMLSGQADVYWRVVFSPEGDLLASAPEDGPVRVWGLTDTFCRTYDYYTVPERCGTIEE
jgi:WD40 repeat protein